MSYEFSTDCFNECRKLINEAYSLSWMLNHYCHQEMKAIPTEEVCHINYFVKKLAKKIDYVESIFIEKQAAGPNSKQTK